MTGRRRAIVSENRPRKRWATHARQNGLDHRRHPRSVCRAFQSLVRPGRRVRARCAAHFVPERHHLFEVAHRGVRAVAVRLVHGEHVGDFEDARLDRLDVVAHPGRNHHQRRVCKARHFEFVLADADRLNEDHVAAVRVEHANDIACGTRQAAEVTARCQRTDEHVRIKEVTLHANAVTEDGAAAEWARWVDGDDSDLPMLGAERFDDAIDKRAFARAGVAGDSENVRLARRAIERREELDVAVATVVDDAHRASSRSDLPGNHPLAKLVVLAHGNTLPQAFPGMGCTLFKARVETRPLTFTASQRGRRDWAINSAVECHLHTVEVAGSSPASPTNDVAGHATRPHSRLSRERASHPR